MLKDFIEMIKGTSTVGHLISAMSAAVISGIMFWSSTNQRLSLLEQGTNYNNAEKKSLQVQIDKMQLDLRDRFDNLDTKEQETQKQLFQIVELINNNLKK